MNVWTDWWQGRCKRAEHNADVMGGHLERLLDSWGPSIAEWVPGREILIDWNENRSHRIHHGGPGAWSERAGAAEQDADRLAQVLQAIDEHHNLAYVQWAPIRSALNEWRVNRELRYRAHPAAHTLEGNLTSGGITG